MHVESLAIRKGNNGASAKEGNHLQAKNAATANSIAHLKAHKLQQDEHLTHHQKPSGKAKKGKEVHKKQTVGYGGAESYLHDYAQDYDYPHDGHVYPHDGHDQYHHDGHDQYHHVHHHHYPAHYPGLSFPCGTSAL